MAAIGSLSVKLGLVTVQWDQATDKAKAQAKQLQRSFQDLTGNFKTLADHFKNMGGSLGLGVAGFAALTHAATNMADEIYDLASAYDLTIGKVIQFQNALATSGGKAENASKILNTLFDKIETAKTGNEAVIKQFQDLGISFADLNNLKADQMLTKVFEGLSNIGDTYQRIAKVKDVVGKGGLGLSLQDMKDALNQSTDAFKSQEDSIVKLAKFADDLKQTMTNLKLAFADIIGVFAPDKIIGVQTFKDIFAAIVAYKTISGLMRFLDICRQIAAVEKDITVSTTILTALGGPAGLLRIGAALAAGGAVYALMKNLNDETERAVGLYQKIDIPKNIPAYGTGAGVKSAPSQQIVDTGLNFAMKEGEGVHLKDKTDDSKNRPELQALDAKIALSRKLLDLEKQSNQNKLDELTTDKMITDLKQVGIKLSTDLANIESQYQQQVASNKDKTPEFLGRLQQQKLADEAKAREESKGASQLIIANANKENKLSAIKLNYQEQLNSISIEEAQLNEKSYKFTDMQVALAREQLDYKKQMADIDNQISEAKVNLAGSSQDEEIKRLESIRATESEVHQIRVQGIVDENMRQQSFSEGWKNALDSYTQEAQNAAQLGGQVFTTLTNSMTDSLMSFIETGKFSFKDFATSIIKDLMRIFIRWQMMNMISMAMGGGPIPFASFIGAPAAKASGGNVDSDKPYMVGENGPELFVPKRNGTIVPHARLNDSMNQQPQTVINGPYIASMNAIDTQSATQFLAKNKQAIWSANQSAQRGIPASR